jgi:hypothetical protein
VQHDQVAGLPESARAKLAAPDPAQASAVAERTVPIPAVPLATVPPAPAVPPTSIRGLALIQHMWDSPGWDKTVQALLLILGTGAAVTGILWGIGHVVEPFAHSAGWAAIGAIAGGGGTGALTVGGLVRRERQRRDR